MTILPNINLQLYLHIILLLKIHNKTSMKISINKISIYSLILLNKIVINVLTFQLLNKYHIIMIIIIMIIVILIDRFHIYIKFIKKY